MIGKKMVYLVNPINPINNDNKPPPKSHFFRWDFNHTQMVYVYGIGFTLW
jgi:hypothetical protein